MKTLILLFSLLPSFNFMSGTIMPEDFTMFREICDRTKKTTFVTDKITCELKMDNYTIRISDYTAYSEISKNTSDSIFVVEESESPKSITEKCQIKISGIEKARISIEQSYQTSVILNDEGPQIVLSDWDHYYSDWEKLHLINGKFETKSQDNKDRNQFSNSDLNKFKKFVKKTLGERWFNVIKDNTTIAENGSYPSFVDVTQILFRIRIQPENAQLIERILVVNLPVYSEQ